MPDGNIIDILAQVPQFSVLVDLVRQAGLKQTLASKSQLCVIPNLSCQNL